MRLKAHGVSVIFCAVLFFARLGFAATGFASGEDGFAAAGEIPGKHFTVLYESGVDIASVAEQLNIGSTDALLAGQAPVAGLSRQQEFSRMLDTLFIRVCTILDMPLYSFQGTLKLCRDDERLKGVYAELFGRNLAPTRPFYAYALNTIYVSAQNCKSGLLGHEIAHAVMSRYFVVLPSVKIQEVLSGYVEYQLRKTAE